MRVLHFYKSFFPEAIGGVAQVINQIAIGSKPLGVETDVLTLTRDKQASTVEMNGYLSHRARMTFQIASTGFSLSTFAKFSQLAQAADVIHYHFPWPFMDIVHFATRIKKPTLVTYHSDIVKQKYLLQLYRPLQNRFLSSVDHIIASSPNYLDTSPVLKNFRDKVTIIPIGIDKASYPSPTPQRLDYWRRRIADRFFLFIGVIRYYKGLHYLMEAAQNAPYPICIVGTGPLEVQLKAKAAALGLRNIHFVGQQTDADKVALLTLCYGLVFPSHIRTEAFGISLLEGAMYGKPLICCEIGTGTTYINVDGKTGLVVPPQNPSALRSAMQQLWDNPTQAQTMGRLAEERYRELFTAKKMVESHVKIYRQLANK